MEVKLDLSNTWIEVPTIEIVKEIDLVNKLNVTSFKVTYHDELNLTIWHFNEGDKGLKAVQLLQESGLSFRWVESKTPVMFLQFGENSLFPDPTYGVDMS